MDWIYDLETFPNVFLCSLIREDSKHERTIEISEFLNETDRLFTMLDYLHENDHCGVGFNNKGFDYPILHRILYRRNSFPRKGSDAAKMIYGFAQDQIQSMRNDKFPKVYKAEDEYFTQIDLYKIWHFDNKAKTTSLKKLEFNMRSKNIEELPFPVGTILTQEQIQILRKYNKHDVNETKKFYEHSSKQIAFRRTLTGKYNRDFLNHNDTKIGKDYFIMRLEEAGIPTHIQHGTERKLIQTHRNGMSLKDAIFNYYDFKRPEFNAVKNWYIGQHIKETKGVFTEIPEHKLLGVAKYANMRERSKKFSGKPTDAELEAFKIEYPNGWVEVVELKAKEAKKYGGQNKLSYWKTWREADTLNVVVDGFQFDFGVGGVHGSLQDKIVRSTNSYKLIDADVTSMYPNLGIVNRIYPQHLTEKFCDIYKDVYEQRKQYAKFTPENAMLKLALNGVYGDSNNQYSIFLDPLYTMKITINGQLSLCLLAEKLMEIEGLKMVQINTDGITAAVPRDKEDKYHEICKSWEKQVGLQLEFAEYERMFIRDVNNYIGVYTNGKIKRKGAYLYEYKEDPGEGWHKDQSALIIQKAASACMVDGKNLEDFIKNHNDPFDFMMRVVLPRNSDLMLILDDGTKVKQQNVTRFYICKTGGYLKKIMPPSKPDHPEREFSVGSNWKVKTCNNMIDFCNDINYDYYIEEAKKLLIGQFKIDNPLNPALSDGAIAKEEETENDGQSYSN